jgi:hypothetical protein
MPASLRRALLIALVPAVAFAGGGRHKKGKGTTKPPPVEATDPKPVDADTKPADTRPADPVPAPVTPTTAPAIAPSGGGGGGAGSGATSGGGSGTSAPQPDTDKQPATNEPDVDALRQEYLSLRDELFKSRARANALASQLYSTRVTVHFTWTSARYYGVKKAVVRLDGANVYEDATGAIATDDGVRFDGYIAPGKHLITFRVEAIGKDDDTFTSETESQVAVKAVANKDLVVMAKGHDGGDIAYEWKRGEHGSYALGIDVGVKTIAHAAEKAAKK